MRNTRNKRNSFNWNKVQRFSIRKLSFGVASCMIGAQFVLSGLNHTAKADGITAYEANGDKVTAYAHGESVYKLRGTSTSIYNAFWMDVDTSKYTKENPIIKVTLTYNAKDNQTGNAPIFWSGRPMHWFTVPEATEELGRDYKLSLTNGSGNTTEFSDWRSWESNSRFIHSKYNGNPDAWERYNTTTKEMLRKTPFVSLNSEFNKVLGDNNNRWYDNSNMPTQDIMRDLRAKSNSIYIDWEKRAAGTVTVSYTTKVKDPEKTKEITIGMGVYQPSNAQQYARVETIKLPVLYKLNEVFEPKEPERTAVENITNLKDDEIAIIREKIWAANLNNTSTLLSNNNAFKDNLKDSSNNGVNSIVIDRTTGKATITYKDDTTDTIEGSNLIYKKPEPSKPVTPSTPPSDTIADDGLVTHSGLSFYTNPLEVDDLNKITPSQRTDARERFKKANLTSDGLSEYTTYEGVSKSNLKAKVNFNLPDGPRNRASINFRGNGENFITLTNIKGGGTLGIVPRDYLFKEKAKPAFDISAAKEEANKLIESLDNLYPNEKLGYKAIIANATDRDSIEIEVNKAKAKANENAVELAKMKKDANDKINELGYLTKEERENAINKINSATIKQGDNNVDSAATNDKRDIDANRDDTSNRLNSVVNELVQQNLQKARQKAIETINSIPNEDLSSDKKTDYINKINAASKIGPASEEGTILNIVEKAQKEASAKEAARKKEEADKVRQQYKDMIANIPGLTDEEKTEYNNAIDAANNVGEMESIVEFAKLTGERKKAIAELGKLDYLNNNQKQSFIDAINDSATKAELDHYVSQAIQLNSKMKQLHDLAAEARKIKPKNGAPQDKYTSAPAEKQTAFNNALADAERVLDKATGADEAITSVGKLFTALETAINELKPGEKVTIPADKTALKAEYDKGDSVKNSPAYTKETNPDKKTAYDKALEEAKKVLDKPDATQDAVDKALEDLEVAKAGLNGKQDEFALTKTDENAVAISIEPVKGEIVSKQEDKDLILGKIKGIPTGATVIYNPIVEKGNKKYVPVKVTHENVSKEIEIEVIKDEILNKPTTKVKVNNTNKLTEKEKEAVKKAVKQANPTLDESRITVNENGEVTVTYQTRPPKTIAASDTVEAGIASKVIPVVSTAKLSEVPKENGTITKEADVQKVKDAVKVTVPTDQPQDVTKELVDGGKVVQGTNQSADGGADNTNKLVVKVKVTYKDESEDVVEVPVEGDTAAKTTPEVSTAKLSEVPKENGTVTKEADVQKVKDAVKLPEVPEGQPQPKKELVDGGKVVQGTDQSKNGGANNTGKLVVKVEVKYPDGSKETVEVPVEGDTAAKTTPEVSTAKLSEVPKENGTITKEADVQKVKDAVKLPEVPKDQPQPKKELVDGGKVVQGTDQSANGGANNTGKLVVKVEVKYPDGSKETVEVPVEGDAAATTTPEVSTAKLSEVPKENGTITKEADVQKVKDAVKLPEVPKDQPQPKKELVDGGKVVQGTDQSANGGANNTGKLVVKVEVKYPDGSKETVEVPVEGDAAATTTPEVSTAKLSEVPKENGTITKEADVQKIKDAVKLLEVPEGQPQPKKELVDGGKVVQGTDQSGNGGANNTGKLVVKVEVKYPDGSKETVEVPVEASDAAKATPKVKEEITSGEVPVSVDPATDKKVAEADKKAITDAVEVPKDQPQPKDKQVKNDGAIVNGTGANEGKKVVVVEVTYPDGSKDEIEVPVRKATDKDKAKADLTKAADAEKAEIDEDNALSKKEKDDLKTQVNELKAKYEENINKAATTDEVTKEAEKGRQEIAAVHTPKDITETAKRKLTPPKERVKVTDINRLTAKEKEAVKKAIVATNPSLEESEVYVDDQGNVASPKGYLEKEKVVVQALNKPATPVVVADPNQLTPKEKEQVQEAVANANPGLNKDEITVDDKGNVTTKNGDELPAKYVVTPALKKPTTPVVVGNPDSLTEKDKENIQNAVAEANKDSNLKPGDVTVNPDGSVSTPKGNLPKEDVITTVIKKPTPPLVVVENPNRLTAKEKEDVKKAVANANPGLTEDKIKVDDQGYVETPLGNLEPKDVITSALKKPTTPVKVNDPSKLTEGEKSKVVEEIIKNNPDLKDKKDKIKVDDQGNVETPKGDLPSEDVVAPTLKKPTTPVIVKNPDQLTNEEKEAIKDAIIAANPELADKKDKVKVDNQGNVETPNGNLPKEDVVTIVLNKPESPVVVSNPNSLTEEEKDKVKDAVAKANPGLDKKAIEVDNQGNVNTPNGGLPAKDVVTSTLKKPTTPVEVVNPAKLTDKEKAKVVEEIVNNNPGLTDKDIKVDDKGNVETPKGNLSAGDVVTPALKKPTTPVEVKDPNNLTDKEKEDVKKGVIEANPGLDKKDITVDNQGNVETPKGNLPTEYIVKVSKGASVTRPALPELSYQDALVAGEVAVEKGKALKAEDILKQLTLVEGVTAKVTFTPSTTETGTKEAEVEITLADGSKVTVKVPVKVYEGERPEVNDLAKAKEDAKRQVEEAANKKIEEINKRTDLLDDEKTAAIEKVNKAKEDANKQIENATSAGTATAIGKEAAENIKNFDPKATPDKGVKPVDPSALDEEKAKAIAEIEQAAKDQIDSINKDLTQEQKDKAIKEIEDLKAKAIENVRKATTKEEVAKVVNDVEKAIKKVDPQPIPTPQPQPQPQPQPGNNGGNGSNQNAQANSDAVEYAKQAAKNILEEAARAKKAQLEEAELSADEKEELFAKVDAEKQAALDEIAKAKDVDTVKQLVTKAVAKIKAIQPARNAQDNQDSQDAQNAQNAQNAQDAQNHSNSNPTSLDAANVRGQELPATGTGSEFVVFNAAAISILTGLGLAIPSKKKETEEK